MIPTTVRLEEDKIEMLTRLSALSKASRSQYIREGIDFVLNKYRIQIQQPATEKNSNNLLEEAIMHYETALRRFELHLGTEIDQAKCLAKLGRIYYMNENPQKAKESLKKALKLCDQHPFCTKHIQKECIKTMEKLQ